MAKNKIKLEKHLILNSYFNDLFGKKNFDEFQSIIKDVKGGFDEEGHSYAFYVFLGQQGIKIPIDELEKYDSNIKSYLDHINRHREKPIVLKYFQYLAVLFTETFLDKYFQDPVKFLNELNYYAVSIKDNEIFFSKEDLIKLAFWMATGSGKTYIVHINYLQFTKYNRGSHAIKLDNVLLITPTENLSDQHLQEMKQNNIPCELFSTFAGGYFSGVIDQDTVKVIDIHKLTEEKKGEGVSIDIEQFGSKNLVFVDEGHKGSGGVKWKRFREFVAKEGFTFEYSATFGQAVASSNKEGDPLLDEYAKSILFNYSYRYFYNDGYGKEYRVLNLKDKSFSESTKDMLMLANLLSFYEQKLLFEDYKNEVKEYNIKEPLWIFVGSKVQGKKEQSDVLRVVQFLSKVLKNENNWSIKSIEKILNGSSGLLDKQDRDIFSPAYPEKKLKYLRENILKPENIYIDLLRRIFYIEKSTPLHLINIKNAKGEIALRVGDAEFFGVINIGDDAQFRKLVEEKTDIPTGSDEVSSSLFDSINNRESKINILIGAKKFIEGWNSWRVSNMGLLNIGKSEGSQIIQLFGRGVRLQGKGFSLKRSSAIEPNPPKYLGILETLNVFGIEANYMEQFREDLEIEGISTDNYVEITLPIKINNSYLEKGLLLPNVDSGRFKSEKFFKLDIDERIAIQVDLMPKVDVITSLKEEGIQATRNNPQRRIEQKYVDLLDWDKIYFTLLEYKIEREWNNYVLSKDVFRKIIEMELYTLYCPDEFVKLQKFEDIWRMEEVVLSILKKYIQSFYNLHKNHWIQKNTEIIQLKKDHGNLNFENYILKIKESDKLIISEIKQLAESKLDKIYKEFNGNYITNVYFDKHIYQPLLVEDNNIEIYPHGLKKEGEETLIEDLRNYFNSNIKLFENKEVFILRNLPRKGVGFFGETSYFYPDFIIWIKTNEKQHLLFIEPHGLGHMWEGFREEKIQLYTKIKDLEKELTKKTGISNILLDSFIISVSPYQDVRAIFNNKPRSILEEKHILFQYDDKSNYIHKLMNAALNN